MGKIHRHSRKTMVHPSAKPPTLPKQILNVKKSVRKIQAHEELKYVDTIVGVTGMTTGGVPLLLNGMQQGNAAAGPTNRQGDQITATSIQFRLKFDSPAAGVFQPGNIRHLIVWDAQANGASFAVGDLLDAASGANLAYCPYKREYQKRFKIVYDKVTPVSVTAVDPNAGTSIYLSSVHYKKAKRALNRLVKYRNAQNTGTITDIASNSLYGVFIADTVNMGANIVGNYRFYFKDD